MCGIMLPDGQWTHVPAPTAGRVAAQRPGPAGRVAAQRRIETPASPREHPDDGRRVAVLVAQHAHGEARVGEQ